MPEFNINPIASPPIGVPIGIILPYVGPLANLPPNWLPCDGRLVIDPTSQFHNQRLPNLNEENRFLMGVNSPPEVNEPRGRNDTPADGAHDHGGVTDGFGGFQPGHINYDRGPGRDDQFMMRFRINGVGNHTHGGENRPACLGVHFIIRVR